MNERLEILVADITRLPVDAIVNAANCLEKVILVAFDAAMADVYRSCLMAA